MRRAATQLTRYLLENGHRELWYFVTSDKKLPVAQERISGYRRAFAEMGLDVEQDWVVGCHAVMISVWNTVMQKRSSFSRVAGHRMGYWH